MAVHAAFTIGAVPPSSYTIVTPTNYDSLEESEVTLWPISHLSQSV